MKSFNYKSSIIWIIAVIVSSIIQFFVTLVLDKVIFINYREVITSNPEIKIFRIGNNLDIYLYYLIIVIVYAVISYLLIWYIQNKYPKYSRKTLIIIMFLIYLPLLLVINKFAPIAKVGGMELISGKAPSNTYLYIFVRPLNGNGIYWPQPKPGDFVIPDQNNRWKLMCNFGGSTGLNYEVVAFSVKNPVITDSTHIQDQYSINEINKIFKEADRFSRLIKHKKE